MPAKPPILEKYRDTVTTFLPGSRGVELGYRCGIMHYRDSATASLQRCSDDVAPILEHVIRLGSVWWASGDTEALPEIHAAMMGLYGTARRLQRALTLASIQHHPA